MAELNALANGGPQAREASSAPPMPGRFGSRDGISLRALLAVSFGALSLLVALVIALVVGHATDQRLRADIGAELAGTAEHLADMLDRGLFERQRDIQIAAAMGEMRDPDAPVEVRRHVLRQIQATYPDYAIVIFISPEGRVLATSSGVLEGSDVSKRDYFQKAKTGPFVGDVHEALLLTPYLNRSPDNPARFIDLAAPVRGPDGRLVGVIAAHLFTEWAEGVQRDIVAPLSGRYSDVEAMILARDGQVVIGPPALRGAGLQKLAPAAAALSAERSGSALTEDRTRLVGFAPTRGHRHYRGLGWRVLIRRDAAASFMPAARLRRQALGWGAAVAGVAALLGWFLAGLIAAPLEALARAARRLRHNPDAPLPAGSFIAEAASLSAAMADMLASLRAREQETLETEARLRAVLEQMPVGVILAEMPAGRIIFQNARALEILQRDVRVAEVLQDHGTFGALHEDGSPYEAEDYPLARAIRLGESVVRECMLHRRPDQSLIHLEVSAAPVRAAPGPMLAVCTFDDVTEARAASQRQRLLAAEVDHRAKNALAVVQAMLRLTRAETLDHFVQAIEGRVGAMARAQTRLADANWNGADLRELLEGEIRPFLSRKLGEGAPTISFRLQGPAVTLAPEATQPISMVFHEMVTNAARHGAFSRPGGCVSLSWEVDAAAGLLRMKWVETSGPYLDGPPARRGFGSRLIDATMRDQLGGVIRRHWLSDGLACELEAPLRHILAGAQVD